MRELPTQQRRVMTKFQEHPELANQRDLDIAAELLDHSDQELRHDVLSDIKKILYATSVEPDEALVSPIITFFDDNDPCIQIQAAEVTGLLAHRYRDSAAGLDATPEDYTYTGLLRAHLDADEPSVRRRIISVLGRLAVTYPDTVITDGLVEDFIEAVEADEPPVASMAAQALGHTGAHLDPHTARDILVTALYDDDPWVRVGALRGLCTLGGTNPDLVSNLVQQVATAIFADHDVVCEEAIATLRHWSLQTNLDCHNAIQHAVSDELQSAHAVECYNKTVGRLYESEIEYIGPQSITPIKNALTNEDTDIRKEAVRALGKAWVVEISSGKNVVESLVPALSDTDPDVRKQAASALENIGIEDPSIVTEAIDPLAAALKDNNQFVRQRAASALEKIGNEDPETVTDAIDPLITALEDDNRFVRKRAASAVGKIGNKDHPAITDIINLLISDLGNASINVRKRAASTLGKIGTVSPSIVGEAIESLIADLDDDSPEVRRLAAYAVGQIGNEHPPTVADAIRPLITALEDDSPKVRNRAASALEKIGSTDSSIVADALDPLCTALEDESPKVRKRAAVAVGKIGSTTKSPTVSEATDPLISSLVNDYGTLRSRAAATLGTIGSNDPSLVTEAIGPLSAALTDNTSDADVQGRAARSLGKIGKKDPSTVIDAIGPLCAALINNDRYVRWNAAIALGNIGGEDPSAVADAIDPLITALQDDHRFVRKQAAEALGKIGSEDGSMVAEALGPLTTALGADNQDVRKQAAEAINRIQPDSYDLGIRSEIREINSRAAIVAMTHLQREPTLGVRPLIREQDVSKATLKNIERIATVVPAWVQPLAPDLRTLLHEDATETRVLACKILASLDDTQSYHQIADLAEEATDPAVQEAASDALTHLKTDDSNPTEPSVPTETAQAESEAELPTAHGQPPEQTPVPDPLPITRSDIAVQSELTDSDSHADRMARVFVAVDESSGRRCVLKELASDGPTKYGPPLQLLEKEGNIWRDFQQKHGVHEHIVRLYEEDTHRGLPWLAMEYMDGGSLRDRLADPADEISLPERLWICVRIAHALTFAHRHRVHHYDIKPANILFRSTGDETWPVPKLSDWGLAELGLTPEEIRSHNMYTPAYAAPEQIDPEHTGSRSARTDIHQFCIVAYELLTETHPFRDEFGRLVSGSASQITPPSEQIAHIPTGIDETILTGLSETPSDRHDSMSQVRDAFERGFQDIAAESDWMLPSH